MTTLPEAAQALLDAIALQRRRIGVPDYVQDHERALRAALSSLSSETEAIAAWMIAHGYVTGHGDTAEDLLAELVAQVSSAAAEKETKP